MRIVAAIVLALLTAGSATSAAAGPSVDELFREFDLFGRWAANCKLPATPANPHVAVTNPGPDLVLESHELGPEFAVNRYSVLTAEKVSPARLQLGVIFQPGRDNEERQKLVIQIGKGTRRTIFNQPEGGAVRVKDGIAVAHGLRTPVLRKCE